MGDANPVRRLLRLSFRLLFTPITVTVEHYSKGTVFTETFASVHEDDRDRCQARCPFKGGHCCPDNKHCCPETYDCFQTSGTWQCKPGSGDKNQQEVKKVVEVEVRHAPEEKKEEEQKEESVADPKQMEAQEESAAASRPANPVTQPESTQSAEESTEDSSESTAPQEESTEESKPPSGPKFRQNIIIVKNINVLTHGFKSSPGM